MSEPPMAGVLEGPPVARMGRRGSFHPLETATITMDMTQPYGSSPKPSSSSAMPNSSSFDSFDFVKSVTKAEPTITMISEMTSDDNPMKYKRTCRRVSLISSDGTFQMDFIAGHGQQPSTITIPETMQVPMASATNTLPDALTIAIPSVESSAASTPMMSPDSESLPTRTRRRGSLLDVVEERQIRAVAVEVRRNNDVIETPSPLEDDHQPPVRAEAPRKKKSSILNSWLFRSPDGGEGEERARDDQVTADIQQAPHQIEGIGGGQLTSRVVSALGIQPPTRKESRKISNLWMPQGM